MILGKLCDFCKGKGLTHNGHLMIDKCKFCNGSGMDGKTGETSMSKMLGLKTEREIRKDAEIKEKLNDLEKKYKETVKKEEKLAIKELEAISTEDLQKMIEVTPKRGRPKKGD